MGCAASKPKVKEHHQNGFTKAPASKAPGPDECFNYSSAAQSPKHTVRLGRIGHSASSNPTDS